MKISPFITQMTAHWPLSSGAMKAIFPVLSLYHFLLIFLLFLWFMSLCLLCPTLSYFFLFFVSKAWVSLETAFPSHSTRCTSTHKVSTASLCWGPSDLSRWGLSWEHLASVLHMKLLTRNPHLFVFKIRNVIHWSWIYYPHATRNP